MLIGLEQILETDRYSDSVAKGLNKNSSGKGLTQFEFDTCLSKIQECAQRILTDLKDDPKLENKVYSLDLPPTKKQSIVINIMLAVAASTHNLALFIQGNTVHVQRIHEVQFVKEYKVSHLTKNQLFAIKLSFECTTAHYAALAKINPNLPQCRIEVPPSVEISQNLRNALVQKMNERNLYTRWVQRNSDNYCIVSREPIIEESTLDELASYFSLNHPALILSLMAIIDPMGVSKETPYLFV